MTTSVFSIRASVWHAWHPFSAPLEGRVPYMYLDVLGLITCGVGNLIDSAKHPSAGLALALALPWRKGERLATPAEVEAAWRELRGAQHLRKLHHRHARAHLEARGLLVTLTDEAIDDLVAAKFASNAVTLARHFPEWPSWSADAQLAAASMAWAMGADWPHKFPLCSAALRARRWDLAAARCKIRDGLDTPSSHDDNAGVVPRNAMNAAHFAEAGCDLAIAYPELLHGPCTLDALRAGWRPSLPIRKATAMLLAAGVA